MLSTYCIIQGLMQCRLAKCTLGFCTFPYLLYQSFTATQSSVLSCPYTIQFPNKQVNSSIVHPFVQRSLTPTAFFKRKTYRWRSLTSPARDLFWMKPPLNDWISASRTPHTPYTNHSADCKVKNKSNSTWMKKSSRNLKSWIEPPPHTSRIPVKLLKNGKIRQV